MVVDYKNVNSEFMEMVNMTETTELIKMAIDTELNDDERAIVRCQIAEEIFLSYVKHLHGNKQYKIANFGIERAKTIEKNVKGNEPTFEHIQRDLDIVASIFSCEIDDGHVILYFNEVYGEHDKSIVLDSLKSYQYHRFLKIVNIRHNCVLLKLYKSK